MDIDSPRCVFPLLTSRLLPWLALPPIELPSLKLLEPKRWYSGNIDSEVELGGIFDGFRTIEVQCSPCEEVHPDISRLKRPDSDTVTAHLGHVSFPENADFWVLPSHPSHCRHSAAPVVAFACTPQTLTSGDPILFMHINYVAAQPPQGVALRERGVRFAHNYTPCCMSPVTSKHGWHGAS